MNVDTGKSISLWYLQRHTTDANQTTFIQYNSMLLLASSADGHISTIMSSVHTIILYEHIFVHIELDMGIILCMYNKYLEATSGVIMLSSNKNLHTISTNMTFMRPHSTGSILGKKMVRKQAKEKDTIN